MLTATYRVDSESPASVRVWQAGDRPLDSAGSVPASDADLCSQIQRALPLPAGMRDLRTVLWRDGDILLVADAYGAALRWELGKGAPDVLPPPQDGQSANIVFTGDGNTLLRYADSGAGTLWQHRPGAWTPVTAPVPAEQVLADVVSAVGLDYGRGGKFERWAHRLDRAGKRQGPAIERQRWGHCSSRAARRPRDRAWLHLRPGAAVGYEQRAGSGVAAPGGTKDSRLRA